MQPLIISAPFGNYVQPAGCTATLGTFTAERRPGRLWRIIKTVRYYPRIGAWVNKIGLRNPGMPWLVERVRAGRADVSDKLVSVHGFCDADWWMLLEQAASIRPLAIELNMSCPNVGHVNWPAELFPRAAGLGVGIVVKLPPVNFEEMTAQALAAGLRAFHCCNTIPVPAGGLSGKPLKPVSLQCIARVKEIAARAGVRDSLTIIGGGGITTAQDVDDYANAGATHAAVGTKVMNPVYLWTDRPLDAVRSRARERLGNRLGG